MGVTWSIALRINTALYEIIQNQAFTRRKMMPTGHNTFSLFHLGPSSVPQVLVVFDMS